MAVERLELEMAEMRTDISDLKQSTSVITDIQKNMVTMNAMEAMMHLAAPNPPNGTPQPQVSRTEGNPTSHDPQGSKVAPVTSSYPVIWSQTSHALGMPIDTRALDTSMASKAIMTDSVTCTTARVPTESVTVCCA
jgi:hypothetical protein